MLRGIFLGHYLDRLRLFGNRAFDGKLCSLIVIFVNLQLVFCIPFYEY